MNNELTIPQAAVSGQTFCTNCDEALCDCGWGGNTWTPRRYTFINEQPYLIVEVL